MLIFFLDVYIDSICFHGNTCIRPSTSDSIETVQLLLQLRTASGVSMIDDDDENDSIRCSAGMGLPSPLPLVLLMSSCPSHHPFPHRQTSA